MAFSERVHDQYLKLLRQELVPALGCTEPIAIAYACAIGRKLLDEFPDRIVLHCSGNILKNAKSVIVPASNGQHGIETAAILGALAGDPSLGMEVLRNVTKEDAEKAAALKEQDICTVLPLFSGITLHILVEMEKGEHTSLVEIQDAHTHVVRKEIDGQKVSCPKEHLCQEKPLSETCHMTLQEIYDFCRLTDVEDLVPILKPQIEYNLAIAEEGLRHAWGSQVGRTLMEEARETTGREKTRLMACAYAAAGSDARMSGCTMPVVINSGSGNQGLTASLPVVIVAREEKVPEETLYRALAFSNLTALYQKSFIGKLSAYCGAVSAGCGAAAGIAFLCGEDLATIEDTITNTLANVSGVICDGANASCAAKIASSIQAGFLGYAMARRDRVIPADDGVVRSSADETIRAVGHVARDGMKQTDEVILDLMCGIQEEEGHA